MLAVWLQLIDISARSGDACAQTQNAYTQKYVTGSFALIHSHINNF